jgi:prepilin-type processing-associated H-X9-DG protein
MNGSVVGFPYVAQVGYGKTCKITDAWSPLCYLIWEPNEKAIGGNGQPIGAGEYNDGANDPSTAGEGIGLLHSTGGGNALALDGHAEFVTKPLFTQYATLNSGPGPGGKTYLYWDVTSSNGH